MLLQVGLLVKEEVNHYIQFLIDCFTTHVHLGKKNGGLIMTLPNMWVQIFYGIAMCVILFRSVKSYALVRDLLFWVVIHLFLSPGWHHYMSFLPFILLWCYHKEAFSGLGLICICVPTLLIGHISKVYMPSTLLLVAHFGLCFSAGSPYVR